MLLRARLEPRGKPLITIPRLTLQFSPLGFFSSVLALPNSLCCLSRSRYFVVPSIPSIFCSCLVLESSLPLIGFLISPCSVNVHLVKRVLPSVHKTINYPTWGVEYSL